LRSSCTRRGSTRLGLQRHDLPVAHRCSEPAAAWLKAPGQTSPLCRLRPISIGVAIRGVEDLTDRFVDLPRARCVLQENSRLNSASCCGMHYSHGRSTGRGVPQPTDLVAAAKEGVHAHLADGFTSPTRFNDVERVVSDRRVVKLRPGWRCGRADACPPRTTRIAAFWAVLSVPRRFESDCSSRPGPIYIGSPVPRLLTIV
jgi:hypothetical protein